MVYTKSEKAVYAQQQTLESLLLNHPLDCPVCDKAGECWLQDYSFHYGRPYSRMIDEKNQPPNKPHISDKITLFTDRCIMCSRCVRFTREISGQAELHIVDRGSHAEIDIFPGVPLNNKLAGNVVDLCPVGALCSKDFLYKQRVWYLKTNNSVCADCSTGCSIHVDHNKDIVYRLRPRENPQAQGYFMCDDGRFGYHYINAHDRLRRPTVRLDKEPVSLPWQNVVGSLQNELLECAGKNGDAIAGVLSPFMTCEEAFLLAKFLKGLSGQVRLALGPVPIVGEDDTYPKDRRGNPTGDVLFTIRKEKCPNRKGVEEILRHFQGEIIPFDDILRAASEENLQAVYIAGGYPPREWRWITEEQGEALSKVPLLVVQDLFPSAASQVARYVLPGAAFAEKDGTYVNHAGLAQHLERCVAPPHDCRNDAQIYFDLLDRRGLPHVPTIRKELAEEIPYFAGLGDGIGEHGVLLG
ncbi:MAG: hypothetical protein KatS3mg105_4450 [Gemmatales bacterium]|nr:MAG: hypothetical protein KatS3mg105_4450 [Gemmatales bacterium]